MHHTQKAREFHFRLDQVQLGSKLSPAVLRERLPMKALKAVNPSFRVRAAEPGSYWRSTVAFTVNDDPDFLALLERFSAVLGRYRVWHVELAFDTPCDCEEDAMDRVVETVRSLRKPWSSRKGLALVDGYTNRSDCFGPSFYFEHRGSRTGPVIYSRYDKQTGQPICRFEYRLVRSSSVKAKTGINEIGDLAHFDPTPFVARYLKFEAVNWDALGTWLFGHKYTEKALRNWVRIQAHKTNTHISLWRCAAQIRGHLMIKRAKARGHSGRPNWFTDKFRRLDDRTLASFFRPTSIDRPIIMCTNHHIST